MKRMKESVILKLLIPAASSYLFISAWGEARLFRNDAFHRNFIEFLPWHALLTLFTVLIAS